MEATESISDVFGRLHERDVERIDKAIAAVDVEIAAQADEDRIFAAYFRFERDSAGKRVVHGNSVKAAERRNDRAHHDRISAVNDVERFCFPGSHIEDVKAANFGVGADPAEIREALIAARAVVAAKIEQ